MIRIPKDVQNKILKKYPNLNIDLKDLVNDLFHEIQQKVFIDGSCTIPGFGSFYCYKTYSKKLSRDVVRFKFSISKALNQSIRIDKYLLDKVREGGKKNTDFDITRISKDGQMRRDQNKALKERGILTNGREKTKKNLQVDEVLSIFENNEDEEQ